MSESLGDILGKKLPREPAEFAVIKKFVHDRLGITPHLALRNKNIIIGMPSAASASSLRFELYELQRNIGLDKKLVIRVD